MCEFYEYPNLEGDIIAEADGMLKKISKEAQEAKVDPIWRKKYFKFRDYG